MNTAVNDFLSNVIFGEPQLFNNLAVLPMHYEDNKLLNYIILDKAMKDNVIEIKEVSSSGSVPELVVANKCFKRILLIDGEELQGAKQNRIINTTILLRKNSETKIPVSCVERGRWNFNSPNFKSSGNVANREMRVKKTMSVTQSLRTSKNFRSDQGEVWKEVDKFMEMNEVNSPTSAMSDVFEKNNYSFDEVVKNFKPVPNQRGFVFFMNGKLMGFDYFSKKSAFKDLYHKILKGYVSDSFSKVKQLSEVDYLTTAWDFLNSIRNCKEEEFKSVGMGNDFRYQSNNVMASSLVVSRFDEKVIHFSGHNIAV